MRDSCIHVRPRPPAARSGAGPRRKRRRPRRFLLGLVAAAVLAHSTPGLADDRPSPGLLLRRARYALAAGDSARARASLLAACALEPTSARGVESAMLLAALEFTTGHREAAERALALPQVAGSGALAASDGLALARAWLALASGDPVTARAAFAGAARSGDETAAHDLAAIGAAWAGLVQGDTAGAITPLAAVARNATDPVLRVAATWSLARAWTAAGEPRRAQHELRGLRRVVRHSSFADDVELAIAIAQIDAGKPSSARQTILRLRRLPASATGPASLPGNAPSLADLRLAPRAFVARLAALFVARPDWSEGPLPFLLRALDRNARADADLVISLVADRKGVAR